MFWEPHTSSIDFCEINYGLSEHVVEIHNTWSSIVGLALFGLLGMWKGNPTQEYRYFLSYFILTVIGIGSAGLHGTLHWIFQSSDELPMIYLVSLLNYCAIEYASPIGKRKYPHLPFALTIMMMINTVIYYQFQHLYIVFYLTFGALSTLNLGLTYRVMANEKENSIAKRIGIMSLISMYAIGLPTWHYEMFHCDTILKHTPESFLYMTPHIIWHFAAGFGAYCYIVCLEACRMGALGLPFKEEYIFGCIPIIVAGCSQDDSSTIKKIK